MYTEPEVETRLLRLDNATQECESLEMLPRTRAHRRKIYFPNLYWSV